MQREAEKQRDVPPPRGLESLKLLGCHRLSGYADHPHHLYVLGSRAAEGSKAAEGLGVKHTQAVVTGVAEVTRVVPAPLAEASSMSREDGPKPEAAEVIIGKETEGVSMLLAELCAAGEEMSCVPEVLAGSQLAALKAMPHAAMVSHLRALGIRKQAERHTVSATAEANGQHKSRTRRA